MSARLSLGKQGPRAEERRHTQKRTPWDTSSTMGTFVLPTYTAPCWFPHQIGGFSHCIWVMNEWNHSPNTKHKYQTGKREELARETPNLDQIARTLPTFPNGLRCNLQNSDGMHSCPRVIFSNLWFLSSGCFVAANFARDLLVGVWSTREAPDLQLCLLRPLVYGWNRAREYLAYGSWQFPGLWHPWDSYVKKKKKNQRAQRTAIKFNFVFCQRSMKKSINKQK